MSGCRAKTGKPCRRCPVRHRPCCGHGQKPIASDTARCGGASARLLSDVSEAARPARQLYRDLARRRMANAAGAPIKALPDGAAALRVFAACTLVLVLASIPLFSTVLPPLLDYPNHLARFWLLATGGDIYYAVQWAPLPNLAGDIVVPLLARAMPLALAGRLF